MTLRQMINHVLERGLITHVTSCVYDTYYDTDAEYIDIMHQYTSVLRELLDLETDSTYEHHMIELTQVTGEDESHIDVHLRQDDNTYAVDYVDWSRLIDLQIRDEVGMQAHVILAHILWEITFHGFTNNIVSENRKALESMCSSLSGD